MLIKQDTPGPYLMDLISCDFSWKFIFGFVLLNVFNKYYISGPYLWDPISWDFVRRSPIGPCLINSTYCYHIRWNWFYVTFIKGPFKHFRLSPIGSCEISRTFKEHIWWTWLHMAFFLKVSYWTVVNKYFMPIRHLMDLFYLTFSGSVLNI